jgi:hypothetical protein
MIARAPAGSPWYRNSWPWFIVGLLGISVLGSLATVYIAYTHRDIEIDRSKGMQIQTYEAERRRPTDGG